MAGSLNTPDVLTQPIAENGDKNTIPATNDQSLGQMSQSTGFPEICSERIADGGKAPRRADFNGVFNMLSRYIFFKQNGGIETFRADVSTAIGGYPKDAILGYRTSTEFKLVRSLIANNTYNFNTTPSYIDDGTHWESVIPMSKNIANWSSNVSNCITEIPQDIKLELNAGTLTLKAGSKVYVPNGAGVFDEVIVPNDSIIQGSGSGTTSLLVFYNTSDPNWLKYDGVVNCFSGSTQPSVYVDMSWYDTTNNVIKYTNNSGSTWTSGLSLPIAIVTLTSGVITSIDQVFNGFGYIGSTVFALPNIKWLTADGRNADGTLKSIEHTNTTVLTTNYPYSDNLYFFMTSLGVFTAGYYVQSETEPTTPYTIWYKPSENILRTKSTGDWSVVNDRIVFARSQTSATRIVSFNPIQAFQAVDYSEFLETDSQNVKVTGNQSINGTKTFTGYYNKFDHYLIVDSIVNAALKAAVDLETIGSNTNVVLRASSPDGNRSGSLKLVCTNGGGAYATAPHEVLGGNGNILTTYNYYWGTNGWYKLGNGLIIQWGWCDTRFSTSRTITFPTAFSSTNYVVSAIPFIVADLAVYQLGYSNKTTTTVNINSSGAANDHEFAWLAIGY